MQSVYADRTVHSRHFSKKPVWLVCIQRSRGGPLKPCWDTLRPTRRAARQAFQGSRVCAMAMRDTYTEYFRRVELLKLGWAKAVKVRLECIR
jgi:hypothetical protein